MAHPTKNTNLTSQSSHWWITIRKNIDLGNDKVKLWCESMAQGEMYAFIEHKGDISADTGEVEGTHYHIALNLPKRTTKSAIINNIVNYFGFDNPFGIRVDIYISFEGCCQYLTHQNESKKTQHDKSEVVHNIELDTFNAIMTTELNTELTATTLQALILESKTPMDLAVKIGLGTFQHYHNTIKMFWRYLKNEVV